MGRRRYRYRKRDDDDGLLWEAMRAASVSPILGVVLIVGFVVGAALCFANPTAIFGIARIFGFLALLCAAITTVFTLSGIAKRWISRISAKTGARHSPPSTRGFASIRSMTTPPQQPMPLPMQLAAKEGSLLTQGEFAFFDPLREIVSGRFELYVKPSLVDVLGCRDHPRFREIAAMHVDFLLCDRKTLRPVLAIELDDRSHNSRSRVDADHLKEQLLAQRRIPLLRQRCEVAYDLLAMREAIDCAISGRTV